jgi:hypothetical protein
MFSPIWQKNLTDGLVISETQARLGWALISGGLAFGALKHAFVYVLALGIAVFFFSMDPLVLHSSTGGYWILAGSTFVCLSTRKPGSLFYLGAGLVAFGLVLYSGGGFVSAEVENGSILNITDNSHFH